MMSVVRVRTRVRVRMKMMKWNLENELNVEVTDQNGAE